MGCHQEDSGHHNSQTAVGEFFHSPFTGKMRVEEGTQNAACTIKSSNDRQDFISMSMADPQAGLADPEGRNEDQEEGPGQKTGKGQVLR